MKRLHFLDGSGGPSHQRNHTIDGHVFAHSTSYGLYDPYCDVLLFFMQQTWQTRNLASDKDIEWKVVELYDDLGKPLPASLRQSPENIDL